MPLVKKFVIRVSVGAAILGLAVAANAFELLAGNYFGNNIVRFDTATGASLGSYSGGTLTGVLGSIVGPDGLLYVCSESNNTIQRFNVATHAYLDTIVSGAGLNAPTGLVFDAAGNMLVSNFNNSTVTKYNSSGGFISTLVASGSGGLSGPDIGITLGPDGKLYVPSFNSNAVLRYDATTGAFLDTFVAAGVGGMSQPRTILFRNNLVWITSDNGNSVLRYTPTGSFVDAFVTPGLGGLNGALGMVFGDDGLLYVSSWRNNRIIRYNATTGAFVDVFASGGLNGVSSLTAVPEPASFLVLGAAAFVFRRRNRSR